MLTAVRAMVMHAVAAGQASGHLVSVLYELADDRDLPEAARGENAGMSCGCGPSTGCMSRNSLWTGPLMLTSSRCSGRAARRGTG